MRIILVFILLISTSFAESWIDTQMRLAQQRANGLNVTGGGGSVIPSSLVGGATQGLFNSGNSQLSQLVGSLSMLSLAGGGIGAGAAAGGLGSKFQNIMSILQTVSTILNTVQMLFGGQQINPMAFLPGGFSNYIAGQGNAINIPGATGSTQGQYFAPGSTISGNLRYNTDGPGTTDNEYHQSQTASTLDGGYYPNLTQHGAVAVAGSGAKIGDLIVVQQGGQYRVVPVTDTTAQTNTVNSLNYGSDIVEVSKHTYDSLGGSSAKATMTNTGVNVSSGNNFNSSTIARVEEVNSKLTNGTRPSDSDLRYIQTGSR